MNSHDAVHLMAFLNFAICTGIGWSCVCRLAMMSAETTKAIYRRKYEILFTAATASGFSPLLFGEWPGFAQLGMSLAALMMCIDSAKSWKHGVPHQAMKPPRELKHSELRHVYGGIERRRKE